MAHYMQVMQLNGVQAQCCEVARCCQDICCALSREAENDVGAEPQVALLCTVYGVLKGRHGMAAVEEHQGLVMPRLQAQFEPEIGACGVVRQEVQHRLRYAVRTCPNGQAYNILT